MNLVWKVTLHFICRGEIQMVTFEEISSWPSQALEEATYKLDNKLSREYGIYTCGSREHIKNVEIEQVESS